MAVLKKFCCLPLRAGTEIIAIVSILACFYCTFSVIWRLGSVQDSLTELVKNKDSDDPIHLISSFFNVLFGMMLYSGVISVLSTLLLFVGAVKERNQLLLPWLALDFSSIILEMILISPYIWFFYHFGFETDALKGFLTLIGRTILDIYFLLIVYSHYQQLLESERKSETSATNSWNLYRKVYYSASNPATLSV